MDYLIEIRAWCLGYDEAEELAALVADLCAERGLAISSGDGSEEVRAMISLKPQGGMLDASDGRAGRVIGRAAKGAQLLIVPSLEGRLFDRPGR